MNKPYICCYMMNSLDGRVRGKYFSTERGASYRGKYADLHVAQCKQAWLTGTGTLMTLQDMVGQTLELSDDVEPQERVDFVAKTDAEIYCVAIDALGELPWKDNVTHKGYNDLDTGREGNHIIEILTEKASDAYIKYLKDMGISYIFAGKDELSYAVAFDKLYNLFGIRHMLLEGGPFVNGCIISEDPTFIDEYSVLQMGSIDAGPDMTTGFAVPNFLPAFETPIDFYFKDVQKVDDTGIWFRYVLDKKNL